jgi:hypothetical protein
MIRQEDKKTLKVEPKLKRTKKISNILYKMTNFSRDRTERNAVGDDEETDPTIQKLKNILLKFKRSQV